MARARHSGNEHGAAPILSGHGELMADFLTRVAQRALGVAAVAKPVIPSRFAPGPRVPARQGVDQEAIYETSVETVAPRKDAAPGPVSRPDPEPRRTARVATADEFEKSEVKPARH